MKSVSVLNDVIGPVMRGPSSSHTAGPFRIGALARGLLGESPRKVRVAFDPGGSFACVYRQQGSDLGFLTGLMGWTITDDRFPRALELAAEQGLQFEFVLESLPAADHPNTVELRLLGTEGRRLTLVAQSIGGGAVVIRQLNGWPVELHGDAHEVLAVVPEREQLSAQELLIQDGQLLGEVTVHRRGEQALLRARRTAPLSPSTLAKLKAVAGEDLWNVAPILHVPCGSPLFSSGAEMLALAEAHGWTLGRTALAHEAALLGLPEAEVLEEMIRRLEVMGRSVEYGLREDLPPMRLVQENAPGVYRAEAQGGLVFGGPHARAAARAMAVMHVDAIQGVVCAAPTAGSAGVLAGVIVTLGEELKLGSEALAMALLAASAVGVVIAARATFAAEEAGCQVEIGAAMAMAAAAVVEAASGRAQQAADAAAIALQNAMGSICDPVQGQVEVPCVTRNAAAASSALVCAELILGGYNNPIPLDETVDAMLQVGRLLPRELRCTGLGGLSLAPSARALGPRL